MQPRRIARELALLSIGQLSTSTQLTESQEIESAMIAAIRALSEEVRETLERASADLNRSSDRILASEIKATDVNSSRAMLNDAIEMTQSAINRLGTTLELPEFIYISQSPEVREFAYSLIRACRTRRAELDAILTQALVDWQLTRLAKIDRNILRLAVAEICILGIPDRVAINEAVELGKRYSTEEGHRFINGVLRRVTQNQKNPHAVSQVEVPSEIPSERPTDDSSNVSPDSQPIDLLANPGPRERGASLGQNLESLSISPPPAKNVEKRPIVSSAIPEIQQQFVPPPVAPAAERQFTEQPPTVDAETPQGQGLEIQQIIPAPPKRVIPSPVKKRVIPSPGGYNSNKRVLPSTSRPSDRKRVIPDPTGHQDRKRVIPAPKSSKPRKPGVDLPIVTTDKRPTQSFETTAHASSDAESFEVSPWETAHVETGVSDLASSPVESADSQLTSVKPQIEESLASTTESSESLQEESLPVDVSPWDAFASGGNASDVSQASSLEDMPLEAVSPEPERPEMPDTEMSDPHASEPLVSQSESPKIDLSEVSAVESFASEMPLSSTVGSQPETPETTPLEPEPATSDSEDL